MHPMLDLTSAWPFRYTCGAGPCPTTNLCQGCIQRRGERTETILTCWRKTLCKTTIKASAPARSPGPTQEPRSAEVPQHQCKSENGLNSCSQLSRSLLCFISKHPLHFGAGTGRCAVFFFLFFFKLPLNSVSTKRDKATVDTAADALNDGLDRIHPAFV